MTEQNGTSSFLRPPRKLSSMMQAAGHDVAADLAAKVDRRRHGAAGREQIVEHGDALSGLDRIGLNLDRVGAVFEVVGEGHGGARQLAALPDHDEAAIEAVGQGRGDEKAARFDADENLRPVRPQRIAKLMHRLVPGAGMREQRRDVVEHGCRVSGNPARCEYAASGPCLPRLADARTGYMGFRFAAQPLWR